MISEQATNIFNSDRILFDREVSMLNTHSRVDEDHNFTSVKTPSFRGSQVFCARHTPRSLLISPNTLISVLLRNTFRSPCLFPTHSDHRASSQHTQVTVPLPNTLRSPCLFLTHSDHRASSQHIQITVPLISTLRSSLHVQLPDTLIKSLFTPEHSHITVNSSKHYNKTEAPPTLTKNAASLPIRTYALLCGRFSVRTLSNSPELSASRTPSERLLLHCREECPFLKDAGNTDIAILHTI